MSRHTTPERLQAAAVLAAAALTRDGALGCTGLPESVALGHTDLTNQRLFAPDPTPAALWQDTAYVTPQLGLNGANVGVHGMAGVAANRSGMGANLTPTVGQGNLLIAAGQNIAAADVGLGYHANLANGGGLNVRGDLIGGANFHGVGASAVYTTADGLRLGGGVGAALSAERCMQVLVDPPAGGAAAGENDVWVRWTSRMAPSIGADFAAGILAIGGGIKVGLGCVYEARYEMPMPRQSAQKWLSYEQAWGRRLRRMGAALGLIGPRLPKLDPSRPLDQDTGVGLVPGASVHLLRTVTLTGGAYVSSYGVRTGTQVSLVRKQELAVRRLDKDTLEVVVQPLRRRGVGVGLDALLLAELHWEHVVADGERVAHRFDIREPSAMAVYAQVLAGTVLAADAELPKGVTCSARETARRSSYEIGGGVPQPFFLAAPVAGLGGRRQRLHGQQRIETPTGVTEVQMRGSRSIRSLFWRGQRSQGVEARWLTNKPSEAGLPAWTGLQAEFKCALSRPGGHMQQHLGERLERSLHVPIAAPRAPRHAAYAITLGRTFSLNEIEQLTRLEDGAWVQAAVRSGLRAPVALKLAQRLQRCGAHADASHGGELQRFLQRTRLPGLATLHSALRGTADALQVTTDIPSVDAALGALANYPVRFDAEPGSKRARAVGAKLVTQLDAALVDVNNDQVLRAFDPDVVVKRLSDLLSARTALRQRLQSELA